MGDVIHIVDMSNKSDTTANSLGNTSIHQRNYIAINNGNNYFNRSSNEQMHFSDTSAESGELLLIVHPDILISPTKVAESCSCIRRSVISEKAKGFGSTSSSAAVMGNVKHALTEVSFAPFLFFCS